MIQVGTYLKVIDNSGAREVYCIGVLSGYKQKYAHLGEIITVAVNKLRTRRRAQSKVKKGDIAKGLIVHTKIPIKKSFGSLAFFENAVVLLSSQNKFIGTRIFGALPKMFRSTKHMKLVFLAAGLII